MAELLINNKTYSLEPYACSPSDMFPFYINVTNACNAKCDFCINGCNKDYGKLDLKELESILDQISNKVTRFSVTGGEPLINPIDVENLLKLLEKYNKPIILNTNGSFLMKNIDMINKYKITSLQLSRHHYEDSKNEEVFKIKTIPFRELISIKTKLKCDLRINCLLIKGYIDSKDEIIKFLEEISKTDINSVGFISMTQVNTFTKEHFIDYRDITDDLGFDFITTLAMHDGDRCCCTNNMYVAKNGKTIFVYFRYKKDYSDSKKSLFYDSTGLKEGY